MEQKSEPAKCRAVSMYNLMQKRRERGREREPAGRQMKIEMGHGFVYLRVSCPWSSCHYNIAENIERILYLFNFSSVAARSNRFQMLDRDGKEMYV